MTDKHREKYLEQDIVSHLTFHGWLEGDQKNYDRALALYPEDLLDWLKETQPKEWEKVQASGGDAGQALLARVAKLLDQDGSLHLLRYGFKHINAKFQLCQFKPGQGLNPETLGRYNRVRCRVVRQVHYSLNNENSIDIVLFVNGIPVATLEVKTDFTQSVHDAIWQYKKDRKPKDPITKKEEPLLAFKKRALVHFAVSSDEVYMTTELKGAATTFLPFNLGNDGGAGNPANPEGYRTSYLWERVLERDSWLNVLGRYVHLEKKEKKAKDGSKKVVESMIFPRFHQWEAVNRLVAAAREEKAGHRYLIQHSAGSGKSNSIAWLAHQLASLHDAGDRKVFDSVIVITDRTVLDDQLQETIFQIEHKLGVVCRVKKEGVKSEQLLKALVDRIPVIIVTIQTFPFVLDAIRETATLKDRTFAVIADEAHSSQTGSAAKTLKQVLTAEQIEEGEEVSAEDMMLAAMAARTQPANISFFAFTATPKHKTLELFGRPGISGLPEAFHVYSMQQAIEEGFILDVLKNYTPYRLAYKLAHGGREYDDEEVDKGEGLKQLVRWVRLHPYNISQKVAIIVEHFRANVMPLLEGRAKAMVVTASRKEAVRYKLAIDKYIREEGYPIRTLVAFSGEVSDPETGPDKFSEYNMNPDLRGQDLREAFDSDEYRILLVANKYQTGFDQPLLVAMYVDKRLAGVAAVQTLSRLNRTYPGKTDTFVLDFVNSPDEVLKAFKPYYKTAELTGVSDPNIVHDLQQKLDASRIYTPSEVDNFVAAYFDPNSGQKQMQAYIAPAVDRYRENRKKALEAAREGDRGKLDALDIFRKDMATFNRAYDFLSQINNYGDTDLEKRSVFYRHLLPLIKTEGQNQLIDLSGVELTHYRLRDIGKRSIKLGGGEDAKLTPLAEVGTGEARERQKAHLSEIIRQMNSLFEGELTDADLLNYAHHIRDKMLESEVLAQQAATNSKEQFALGDFDGVMMDAVIEGLGSYQEMASQVLGNEKVQQGFKSILLELVYRAFRQQSAGNQELN